MNTRTKENLKQNWEKPAIISVMLLCAYLTIWGIWNEGNANAYYTAAVRSMLSSWHNFFFASFDPSGFITVDKPAPGLWIQCLSAQIFGVHGWSVILPEALCSVASVWVLYRIISRDFGKAAGVLSALLLALTPIFIAASRSNNLDAALVLVCLIAMSFALKAAEKGSLKYLLIAMCLIGFGFNIKMLQAYMFLPAVYIVYFFAANTKWKKRIGHLAISTVLLIAVSLSWAVVVDMTPEDLRPYVGSSSTNSELELALGYNGLQRLLPSSVQALLSSSALSDTLGTLVDENSGVPNEGGQAGALRMFNEEMASQASWLLILAMLGLIALLITLLRKDTKDKRLYLRHLLLWIGLFIPMYVFFSISGHFHRYYLIMFAPCIAALSAICITLLWRWYRQRELEGFSRLLILLLPAAIAVTAAGEAYILSSYSAYEQTLVPVLCIAAGISVIGLVVFLFADINRWRLSKLAASIGIAALLIAPAYWSFAPIIFGNNVSVPVAKVGTAVSNKASDSSIGGGESRGGTGVQEGQLAQDGQEIPNSSTNSTPRQAQGNLPKAGQGGNNNWDGGLEPLAGGRDSSLSEEIIQYMMANYAGERFLVAVPRAGSAESIIIDYGVGVMAIGGFKGSDNAISLDEFIALVEKGEIRYFWSSGNGRSDITQWVQENGCEVSQAEVLGQTSAASSGSGLYDLSPLEMEG